MTHKMHSDPEQLKPLNVWSSLTRTALGATHAERDYVVVIDFLELDKDAKIFRDGFLVARDSTPVRRAIDDITIVAETTMLGVRNATLDTPDGPVRMEPLPETWEYRRMMWGERHPVANRIIAATSWTILAVAAVLGTLFLIELLSGLLNDRFPDFEYSFEVPFTLPGSFISVFGVLTLLAALDRALRLKYSWWLDSDIGEFIE